MKNIKKNKALHLIDEIQLLKENILDKQSLTANIIHIDYKKKCEKMLPEVSKLILDLKVKEFDITLCEYLIYKELVADKKNETNEVSVIIPEIHTLRTTPLNVILNSISFITNNTLINIQDTFGLLSGSKKSIDGSDTEYLKPKLESFYIKGNFDLNHYKNN